nr:MULTISPECIES: ABC transporter substrate-binding protein [Halomonas]
MATAQSKEEQLREYVRENSIRLVDQLNEIRELYNSDREAFYEAMDDALGEFVAFRRVAARIMGKYARQASPEERDEFVRAFRRSLYDAYGGAAVSIDSSDFELEVDSVKINPRHEDRATVNLSIITNSGERYGVAYSMYEPDDGNWQVENVIVEGINMGLAFRDRFEQEMRAAEGNVSRVIDEWSADVGDIEGLEDAVDQQKGNG